MGTPRTKLFVGHLPDGCTNEELQCLFEKFGSVAECDVINKYGFVHMSSPAEAQEAIQGLNNYNFRGASISVEPSKSKLHPEPGAPGRAKGGMPPRGMPFRGRGGYMGGFTNGTRRFDGPPQYGGNGGGDYYGERPPYGMGGRPRPYPSPYERRGPSMPPPRDEYSYRPSPYPESYPRSAAPPHSDMYERRATTYPSTSEYLYSRRSPSEQGLPQSRPYWYGESAGEMYENSRPPAAPARRPYF